MRWWGFGTQWHQLDHMQTICTSLQTDNHTNTSSLTFYRPDALPDAQPTVSKHWRHTHWRHITCNQTLSSEISGVVRAGIAGGHASPDTRDAIFNDFEPFENLFVLYNHRAYYIVISSTGYFIFTFMCTQVCRQSTIRTWTRHPEQKPYRPYTSLKKTLFRCQTCRLWGLDNTACSVVFLITFAQFNQIYAQNYVPSFERRQLTCGEGDGSAEIWPRNWVGVESLEASRANQQ